MDRPLAVVGFTYLAALVFACMCGLSVSFWSSIFCIAVFAVSMFIPFLRRAQVIPTAFVTAAAALMLYCAFSWFAVAPARQYNDKTVSVTGAVVERVEFNGYNYQYEIKTKTVDGVSQKFKFLLISNRYLDVDYYDELTFDAQMFTPVDNSDFNRRVYYESRGIYMQAFPKGDVTAAPVSSKPLYYHVIRYREKLTRNLKMLLPGDEGALVRGILLGDQSDLSDKMVYDFRETGIYHLLVVSGTHTALIAGLLLSLFVFLRIPKRLAAVLAAVGVFGFMALTGFTSSVNRAGIMGIIYLLGIAVGRQSDPFNSLGAAVLIITLTNPFAGADIGLLTSFCSTLGILLFTGKIRDKLCVAGERIGIFRKPVRWISSVVAQSVAATVGITPILILVFGWVSLIGPITNIFAIPPAEVCVVAGGMAALLSCIPVVGVFAKPFAFAAGICAKFMIGLASLFAKIPFAAVRTDYDFIKVWLALTLIMLVVCLILRDKKRVVRWCAALSAAVLLCGIVTNTLMMRDVTTITTLDVQKGGCIIVSRQGRSMVIGCGGSRSAGRTALNYLRNIRALHIDLLLLPSLETKDAWGAQTILENCAVDTLILPEDGALADTVYSTVDGNTQCKTLQDMQVFLWNDVCVTCRDNQILLQIGNTNFTIGLHGADVPDSGTSIAYGAMPGNIGEMEYGSVVVSSTTRDSLDDATVQKLGDRLIPSEPFGKVDLFTRGDGQFYYRRGNAWR